MRTRLLPKFLVIAVAKLITAMLRLRGGGTALPGLVAERLRPQLLGDLFGALPEGVAVVTGTNGKTTTTRMLVSLLESTGMKVLTNREGSNCTRGVLSAAIEACDLFGRLDHDIAVIEIDEAYAPVFCASVAPRLLVALNVHRDQLDRFGEIDKTAGLIGAAADLAGEVVVNGDDDLLAPIGLRHPRSNFFGMDRQLRAQLPGDAWLHESGSSERIASIAPGLELVAFDDAIDAAELTFESAGDRRHCAYRLRGLHNASNATAATLAAFRLRPDIGIDRFIDLLHNVTAPPGRGEEREVRNRHVTIRLAKNPAGFNQNVANLAQENVKAAVVMINDDYADGRDVSWLWDANVEALGAVDHVVVAGVRAYDMALRLQYAGVAFDAVIEDIEEAMGFGLDAAGEGENVLILPTYTAMTKTSKILNGKAWRDAYANDAATDANRSPVRTRDERLRRHRERADSSQAA